MIRDEAALKCARAILGPFVERGLIEETGVKLAATIVQKHVEADELDQEIAAIEKRIAAREPA